MRRSFNAEEQSTLSEITYLVGSSETIEGMITAPVKEAFSADILEFLASVSKELMESREAKAYPDVITLGFWLRKGNVNRLKEKYGFGERSDTFHLGRGIAFHIAPSNVPVNFAYSLFTGLMTGNRNIVRVPSKEFPQVSLIVKAIKKVLEKYREFKPYIVLVRYDRNKEINDILSSIADTRMIWGGDATIAEIRKSVLPPRSTEFTFADRFSLAVIDSDEYMKMISDESIAGGDNLVKVSNDKEDAGLSMKRKVLSAAQRIASDFYNDTYLSDQNACTSPRLIVWTGGRREEAKERFWEELHELVKQKYEFQPIMAVNKLTASYLTAVHEENVHIERKTCIGSNDCIGRGIPVWKVEDNLIVRVRIESPGKPTANLIDMRECCGFFFEYDTDHLMDLKELCSDNRVQTVGVIGNKEMLEPLVLSGVSGIDRIVPIGHTMDFDLIWDGYDLSRSLTRTVAV